MGHRPLRRLTAALLLGTCLSPCAAWAIDHPVTTEAQLRTAITSAGAGDTITFNANITLTQDLPAVQTNVTIIGNNNTLSGNNQFRGLFIGAFSGSTQTAVAVTVQDLNIANARAAGGSSANGLGGGGGGGGFGGALFVANQATVTVSNVNLTNNAAAGGAGTFGTVGGGGGMGGNGTGGSSIGAGADGGGGGLGSGATSGNGSVNAGAGIATGANGGGASGNGATSPGTDGGGGGGGSDGGGGGVGGTAGTSGGGGTGGAGGFGGGGGGGTASGGAGGFGGGGGSALTNGGDGGFGGGGGKGANGTGGSGGFGGGNGSSGGGNPGGSGGGAGMGGAIFVQGGGSLNLAGSLTVNGNSVSGGAGGGNGGTAGSAFGSGIFLQGGSGTLTFTPGSGQSQTVSNVIADQTGSGGTGGNAGSYALVKEGAGLTTLSGNNTYSGGTSLNAGTLAVGHNNALGTGTLTFTSGTTLQAAANGLNVGNAMTLAGTSTVDTQANALTLSGSLGGTGALTKIGNGMLTLSGSNSYQGGTTINGGLINFSNANNFGSGAITLNGGGLQWATGNATDISNRLAPLGAAGGTVDTNGNNVTFANVVSGTGGLTKTGDGVLTLSASNTYEGGTAVNGGTLAAGATNTFSSASAVTVGASGTLALQAFSQIIGSLAGSGTVQNGGATAATLMAGVNDSSTVFSGVLADGGSGTLALVKMGLGTMTLTGASTYTGGTEVGDGTLSISAENNLGAVSGGLALNEGTLQTTASFATTRTLTLNGNGGTIEVASGTTFTQNGNVGGGGILTKTGTGALVLGGTNTHGGTTVNDGLLQLAFGASLASGGALTVNGGTFDLNSNNQTVGALSGTGGTIELDSGTLTTNSASNTTLGASITGAGNLVKQGPGTLTLTAVNDYTGSTTIEAGSTLALSGSGSIAASSGVSLSGAGATFDVSASTAGATIRDLSGAAGSTIQLGGSTLTVGTANSTTFSGTISGVGGSLVKQGTGTLTLTGTSDFSGQTSLNGGTIAIDNTSALGTSAVQLGGGMLLGLTDVTFTNSMSVTNGTIAAAAGTTLSLTPSSFSSGAGSSLTFGSATDTGRVELSLPSLSFTPDTVTVAGGTLALIDAPDFSLSTMTVNGTLDISGNSFPQTFVRSLAGSGTVQLGGSGLVIFEAAGEFSGTIGDGGGFGGIEIVTGTQTLSGVNTYTNATQIDGGATLALKGDGSIASSAFVGFLPFFGAATFDISQTNSGAAVAALVDPFGVGVVNLGGKTLTITTGPATIFNGVIQNGGLGGGSGGSLVIGSNAGIQLGGINTYTGATVLMDNATLSLAGSGSIASSSVVNLAGAGALLDISGSGVNQTIRNLAGVAGSTVQLGANSLIVGSASSTTFAGTIEGSGGLIKVGTGVLTLAGDNTYTGGTILNVGGLTVSGSLASGVMVNGGNLLVSGRVAGDVMQNGGSTALSGTVAGGFTLNAGTAALNGTVTGLVTANGGALSGTGTLGGLVASNATLMPGNSIGTLNIAGNFSQSGGVYQVEINAQGQGDRINATGTATLSGGTVLVLAQPGNYATSTTYTILSATGGVSGAYAGVTSDFAFMTSSLSYDANNVFLTLALQGSTPFSGFGGNTPNQRAVGYALDQSYANASGDFATVIGALANLNTQQASPTLNTISGQQYADFGTTNVNTSAMFMNTLGQQMALARGGQGTGQRQALAMACEVEACDTARPLSAWFSGLGGLGSVQGNTNSSTLTYNFGGAAAGIDYRLNPMFLVGLGVGYTHGTQWVQSFQGKGWSDSVNVAAYGSFTYAGFYADALAGYAYFSNQMQRQISVPGLQPRTASGSTGANQFLTQVETGYALPVFGAKLSATPFARLQFSTTSQNGFSESGAQSLSLNVAQQTTNSLRTVLGAELSSDLPLSSERSLGLALRLGWQHEYDDTGRPITAAFSGAPSAAFTVYGATPTRDAAILGFSANTTVSEATQLYLRYDGTLASGTDNHAFTAGLLMSW